MSHGGFAPGLEIDTGPMYGKKTWALIGHVDRYRHALDPDQVSVFYPERDKRTAPGTIQTRLSSVSFSAKPFSRIRDILELTDERTRVSGIDEIQFVPDSPQEVKRVIVDELVRKRGQRVLVAGLNLDFCGNPFEVIRELMPFAERVTVNHAVCMVRDNGSKCGRPAFFSQLFIDGTLAGSGTPRVVVQKTTSEDYQARCGLHFVWPD